MLGKVSDTQLGIAGIASLKRRQFSRKGFHQGCFAGSISSQQANAFTVRQTKVDARQDWILIACINPLEINQLMWGVVWSFKLEDKSILLLHGRNNLQAFQRLDTALSLFRFGGLITKNRVALICFLSSHYFSYFLVEKLR